MLTSNTLFGENINIMAAYQGKIDKNTTVSPLTLFVSHNKVFVRGNTRKSSQMAVFVHLAFE